MTQTAVAEPSPKAWLGPNLCIYELHVLFADDDQ